MDFVIYNSYEELISSAKTQHRVIFKGGPYYEVHHIIPRSQGGTDTEDNLVILTLFEHFQAHFLLAKKYENDKENQQAFFANLAACDLCLTGKKQNIKRLQEAESILKNEEAFKLVEQQKILNKLRPSPVLGKAWVMKDGRRTCINANDVTKYKKMGYTKQLSEKRWFQKDTQKPVLYNEKSWEKLRARGMKELCDCPICHKANSTESFACSSEHYEEYLTQCKNQYRELKAMQSANTWKDPNVAAARKSNISKAQQEKHYSEGFCWVMNEEKSVRIRKNEVDDYLSKGFTLGRKIK